MMLLPFTIDNCQQFRLVLDVESAWISIGKRHCYLSELFSSGEAFSLSFPAHMVSQRSFSRLPMFRCLTLHDISFWLAVELVSRRAPSSSFWFVHAHWNPSPVARLGSAPLISSLNFVNDMHTSDECTRLCCCMIRYWSDTSSSLMSAVPLPPQTASVALLWNEFKMNVICSMKRWRWADHHHHHLCYGLWLAVHCETSSLSQALALMLQRTYYIVHHCHHDIHPLIIRLNVITFHIALVPEPYRQYPIMTQECVIRIISYDRCSSRVPRTAP